MGSHVMRAVVDAPDLELVGACDRNGEGHTVQSQIGDNAPDLEISSKLGAMLDQTAPHVLIEFTHHAGAADHALSALKRGISPVIGTSGLSGSDQRELQIASEDYKVPVLLVPNFALGAVLMARFAEDAARYFPDAEVIELHHEQKLDAPSGTAWHTAERIAAARSRTPSRPHGAVQKADGARGGSVKGVQVHSVRLPGYVASQEVLFGGAGERLSIRHDSIGRESFMAGVLLAVRRVRSLTGFNVGLEAVLDQ